MAITLSNYKDIVQTTVQGLSNKPNDFWYEVAYDSFDNAVGIDIYDFDFDFICMIPLWKIKLHTKSAKRWIKYIKSIPELQKYLCSTQDSN